MKLGIIVSTSFSNWNGQLEKEIYANFGDKRITEVLTRGTKGMYKSIAMYAKKNKICLINVKDSNNPNEQIVSESDSLLVFLDEKRRNKTAWDIIRKAKTLNKQFCVAKTIPQPPLEGTEKEIMEHLAKLFDLGWLVGKDIHEYFKRYKQHFKTFAGYVEKGKQMDKNRILYKLSELYLQGFYANNTTYESDEDVEVYIAYQCITAVFEQLSPNVDEYNQKIDNYAEILHNINPIFPIDIKNYKILKEEYFTSFVELIRWCFQNKIPAYEKHDEEMCSSLCIGLWWCLISKI